MLDLLGSLVDQSLVIAEDTRLGVRYRLLETVRQYGLERLTEAGEEETLHATATATHYLALAERAGPHLETARQLEFLELLDPEAANLAAAIDHALRSEPAVRAALLRGALSLVVHARPLRRGRARAFALARCLRRHANPRCAHGRSKVAPTSRSGWAISKQSEVYATEALALAEEVGDRATAARARCEVGSAVQFVNPRAGRAELAARGRAREGGRRRLGARGLRAADGPYLPVQGEHAEATRANEEVAALAERLGDPLQVARRWVWVAVPAHFDGRFAEAREALERLRAAVAATGEPVWEAFADIFTGLIDVWEGEAERPLEYLRAAARTRPEARRRDRRAVAATRDRLG